METEQQKLYAAQKVLDFIQDGMRLGIGTGSTANIFIELLANKVQEGLKIKAVPTSIRSDELCKQLGIKTYTLEEMPQLDLTIDGADEITPNLSLIKGGGGALLREKIVATASHSTIVIADESKLVEHLGAFPLPIEINSFGMVTTEHMIKKMFEKLGLESSLSLRKDQKGHIYETDGGHYIIDAQLTAINKQEEEN